MDRAHTCPVQRSQEREPIIPVRGRRGRQPLVALGTYPIAHLAHGAIGEGDRHQLVQVARRRFGIARLQVREESLGEDKRLATAGPG